MNYKSIFAVAVFFIYSSLLSFGAEEDLFDNPMVRDRISLGNRPIYFDNDERADLDGVVVEGDYLPDGGRLEYHYLSNRRALTGENCAINKLPNAVTVGGWTGNLDALLNDDLNDHCKFNAVASVGVTVNPLVSIRDRSCYYAKGTEAGFCMVAGSGNTVLSLDVVKALAIGFYRDGELVGVMPVKEGQTGSGVTLSLVQIPGTDESCVSLTAEAPGVFDEVMLDFSGGVNVGAGQLLRIKYGFVGKSRIFTITKNEVNGSVSADNEVTPFQKYSPDNRDVGLDYVKAWNPVLLGLPFPVIKSELDKFIDADLENYISLTPIIAVGYQGGAKFMMKDGSDSTREVYPAGTEVGFCYDFGAALTLDLGTFMNIVLFDHNGNKVADETVSAGVLSLSLAKGGGGNVSLVSKVPFSGAEIRFLTTIGVDLGGIFVKYAYVREPADIRHHCPINPSMDTSICPGSPEYQLRSNPAVSVTWTLEEQPEGGECSVTPDGYVTGMKVIEDPDGTLHNSYRFKATAADGCFDFVTLAFDGFDETDCAIPIVNGYGDKPDDAEYVVDAHVEGVDGGLLIIDKLRDADNILHDDEEYAVYTGGLKLADNVPIIGIRRRNGFIYDSETEFGNSGKRLGFIVRSKVEGLNLSLLNFYQIRCYNEGKEVFRSVIDETNVVSADVGGSNASQKMRFSVVVPYIDDNGRPTKVDQMILWSSGVIDIEIGELDIYNAFWEDPESQCADVMGCSTTLLTTEDTHTLLDFGNMQAGDGVALGSAIDNLDNIVDGDKESYATIFKTVGISGVTIAVDLGRTLDYRHQLGVIMDNKTYVAGVKVADVIQVETMYRGKKTGDKFGDWNIIDANVIGYGDKKHIIIQPKYPYDEVLITFIGTVNVLNDINVYGLFVRGDVDGDGVPDCQDSMPCSDIITGLTVNEVCVGDDIVVYATGNPGRYPISFSDPILAESQGNEGLSEIAIDEDRKGSLSYKTATPGMYQVVIYDNEGKPSKSASYKVHPVRTSWLVSASTSDWSKWDNWSDGAPYCCTDVIIPSGATIYPDLDGVVSEGDEYCCNRIHFEPRAEIANVVNLNYVKAWVELELEANRYHLLSAPLHDMFTGDMFIPASMKGVHEGDYFKNLRESVLNDESDAECRQNRFDPTIYQRRWYATSTERLWSEKGDYKLLNFKMDKATVTKWSREFNHLVTPYVLAEGFSLWVDNGTLAEDTRFRFRFPKEHTRYDYFNDFTREVIPGVSEEGIAREKSGRFIYESDDSMGKTFVKIENGKERYNRKVYNKIDGLTLSLQAGEPTDVFLFGNPFMSPIDIARLIEGNPEVREIKMYDGNSVCTVARGENGICVATSDEKFIRPLQSVFVKVDREENSNRFDIRLISDMLKRKAPEEVDKNDLRALNIILSNDRWSSGLVVTDSISGVETEALFDNEVMPSLALFAVNGERCYDIIEERYRMPLTIIKNPGEKAYLEFRSFGNFKREDFRLIDLYEGEEYSLDHDVELPVEMGTSSGRFILLNLSSSENDAPRDQLSDIMIEYADGMLNVKSPDVRLERIEVYDLEGSCLYDSGCRGAWEVVFNMSAGIRIVRVLTQDGEERGFKLLLK